MNTSLTKLDYVLLSPTKAQALTALEAIIASRTPPPRIMQDVMRAAIEKKWPT